jgi:Amt family ammonium transporter
VSGGAQTLWTQTYGTLTVAAATFAVSMAVMYAVKLTGTLRISEKGELEGLDVHEHGSNAYPEFVVTRGMTSYLQMPPALGAMPYPAPTMQPGTSTSSISLDN